MELGGPPPGTPPPLDDDDDGGGDDDDEPPPPAGDPPQLPPRAAPAAEVTPSGSTSHTNPLAGTVAAPQLSAAPAAGQRPRRKSRLARLFGR